VAGHGHDHSVAYADIVAPPADIDLDAWECWAHHGDGSADYYAKGPCPGCGATSQGHIADAGQPIESLGHARRPAPPSTTEPVEVPVRCTCGSPHGRHGATSCGRRWTIICPPQP
jgi:hypothetical protein